MRTLSSNISRGCPSRRCAPLGSTQLRTSRGRAGYARGFVPAVHGAVVRLRGSRQARSRVVASEHVVCLRCGTGRQARGRAVVILPSLLQYAVTARRKARSARRRVVSAHAVALRVRGRGRADERGRAGLRSCVAPIVDPGRHDTVFLLRSLTPVVRHVAENA